MSDSFLASIPSASKWPWLINLRACALRSCSRSWRSEGGPGWTRSQQHKLHLLNVCKLPRPRSTMAWMCVVLWDRLTSCASMSASMWLCFFSRLSTPPRSRPQSSDDSSASVYGHTSHHSTAHSTPSQAVQREATQIYIRTYNT